MNTQDQEKHYLFNVISHDISDSKPNRRGPDHVRECGKCELRMN